jgi:hypothetical protein
VKFKAYLPITVALAALLANGPAVCGSGRPPTATTAPQGTLSGQISVGPLCPVEPCDTPVVSPYDGLEVVLSRDGAEAARIAVGADGSFSGEAPAGEYELDVQPCQFLGCNAALPLDVSVGSGQTETVTIDIDTGIR